MAKKNFLRRFPWFTVIFFSISLALLVSVIIAAAEARKAPFQWVRFSQNYDSIAGGWTTHDFLGCRGDLFYFTSVRSEDGPGAWDKEEANGTAYRFETEANLDEIPIPFPMIEWEESAIGLAYKPRPSFNCAGVDVERETVGVEHLLHIQLSTTDTIILISIPVLFFSWRLFRRFRMMRREQARLCASCGYDLRAHAAGGNCPECGRMVP